MMNWLHVSRLNPQYHVMNDGPGPVPGGLWCRVAWIHGKKILVTSSSQRFASGGTAFYKELRDGVFGKPKWYNAIPGMHGIQKTSKNPKRQKQFIPGGPVCFWPSGGLLTYDSTWGTILFHPLTSKGFPAPRHEGVGIPVFSKMDAPRMPAGSASSITTGDVTGNGHLDIILNVSSWREDGYHPDGKRWNHPEFTPYNSRGSNTVGNDISRDERAPFWGSKALSKYMPETWKDEEGCTRVSCKRIWDGPAGERIMCTALPSRGSLEFSTNRTYRGNSPRGRFIVLEGDGTMNDIEKTSSSFKYAGMLLESSGEELVTFGQTGVVVLPNGDLFTIDFVGMMQYFRRIESKKFTELPVSVQDGFAPTLHGPIGTACLSGTSLENDEDDSWLLVISGENGLISKVRAWISEVGLKIESPEGNIAIAKKCSFKDDILVVPTFLDSTTLALGSGAGTFTKARIMPGTNPVTARHEGNFSPLRVVAGPVGSVQGTTEEKWGYTCPTAFDWEGDGSRVLVCGDISEYIWLVDREGGRVVLRDEAGKPVRVAWRVRPGVFEWKGDVFIVTLDLEDRITIFKRCEDAIEFSGHVLNATGSPACFHRHGGSKGRLKFEIVDIEDVNASFPTILVGTSGVSIDLHHEDGENAGSFQTGGAVVGIFPPAANAKGMDSWFISSFRILHDVLPVRFGSHSAAPSLIPKEWNGRSPKKGSEILVGAEDGRLYHFPTPRFQSIHSIV